MSDEMYLSVSPRSAREIALEEFNRLNENHHPEPLSDEKLAELDRIMAAAERTAESLK